MPSGVKDIQLLELKDTISQLNKTISTQNELIGIPGVLSSKCSRKFPKNLLN